MPTEPPLLLLVVLLPELEEVVVVVLETTPPVEEKPEPEVPEVPEEPEELLREPDPKMEAVALLATGAAAPAGLRWPTEEVDTGLVAGRERMVTKPSSTSRSSE